MEVVSGISIKNIFQDNNNWYGFFCDNESNLRSAITDNVLKMLSCRTHLMGYHKYVCLECKDHYRVVNHSCKSRFCSSCGKKATDEWIAKNNDKLPDTLWQHITFTLPDKYWDLFWLNRDLVGIVAAIAANIIKQIAANRNIDLGIFLAIHTFGRDLKRNYHIHLSVTLRGIYNEKKIKKIYFDHQLLKNKWKYCITDLLRARYKSGNLKLPKSWNDFNTTLDRIYKKQWVVHLGKPSNHKRNIEYLGKYLKRPPIGEARIKNYDGKNVTFNYLDHYDKKIKTFIIPVIDFIKRLISHIPDKYFRVIRYYGILSNRRISKDLPIFNELLTVYNADEDKKNKKKSYKKEKITFRSLFIKTFGRDPLQCPKCKVTMVQYMACYFDKTLLRSLHKQIAQKMA
jgi:hypothetical protein